MTKLRRWLLGLAAGWFGAGVMVGLALPRGIEAWFPGEKQESADEEYVRLMAKRYGLSREQQELLYAVRTDQRKGELHLYENAMRDNWDQLPKPMQSEILNTARKAEQRLEALLTRDQLERFKRDRGSAPEERGPGK